MKLNKTLILGLCSVALLASCKGGNYGTEYKVAEFKTKVLEMYKKTEKFSTTNSTYNKFSGKVTWEVSSNDDEATKSVKIVLAYFILGSGLKDYNEYVKYAEQLDDKNTKGVEISDSTIKEKYFYNTNTGITEDLYYINNDGNHFDKLDALFKNLKGGDQFEIKHAIKGNLSTIYVSIDDYSKLQSDLKGTAESAFIYGSDDKALEGYGYLNKEVSKMEQKYKLNDKDVTLKMNYTITLTPEA